MRSGGQEEGKEEDERREAGGYGWEGGLGRGRKGGRKTEENVRGRMLCKVSGGERKVGRTEYKGKGRRY